jgi:Phytanoyl-CoA dioxygenase (PhyH)
VTFSEKELDQFRADGFVILRDGFAREIATECREFVWKEILSWRDCSTSGQPFVHVRRNLSGPPFDRVLNRRLREAIDQLTGPGRAVVHESFGWWPVLFPGFPGPAGWHVDGSNFRHHLSSPEQGLVTLYLFSDIGPGDGGTPMVRGSHRAIARLLHQAEPGGLSTHELQVKLPPVDLSHVVEVTGQAGDVAMMHPFLIHGFGPNRGHRIRFACNPQYHLMQPMNFQRRCGDQSPAEEAVMHVLG